MRNTRVLKFVCVEVLRPNQPSGVMSSAVSLPTHVYWAGLLTSLVHILSPEMFSTDMLCIFWRDSVSNIEVHIVKDTFFRQTRTGF